MKKALIIGINGFAGSYLRKELEGSYDVYGAAVSYTHLTLPTIYSV